MLGALILGAPGALTLGKAVEAPGSETLPTGLLNEPILAIGMPLVDKLGVLGVEMLLSDGTLPRLLGTFVLGRLGPLILGTLAEAGGRETLPMAAGILAVLNPGIEPVLIVGAFGGTGGVRLPIPESAERESTDRLPDVLVDGLGGDAGEVPVAAVCEVEPGGDCVGDVLPAVVVGGVVPAVVGVVAPGGAIGGMAAEAPGSKPDGALGEDRDNEGPLEGKLATGIEAEGNRVLELNP